MAIAKARGAGAAWVGARWSNHAGPASLYAKMPMRAGMIGQYLAVGNANHLPPWGGVEMLLSTNPVAVAIPALEEPPVVLDMATTVAAFGKVKEGTPVLYVAPTGDYPALVRLRDSNFAAIPKHEASRLLEVNADHMGAPSAASRQVGEWIRSVAGV